MKHKKPNSRQLSTMAKEHNKIRKSHCTGRRNGLPHQGDKECERRRQKMRTGEYSDPNYSGHNR